MTVGWRYGSTASTWWLVTARVCALATYHPWQYIYLSLLPRADLVSYLFEECVFPNLWLKIHVSVFDRLCVVYLKFFGVYIYIKGHSHLTLDLGSSIWEPSSLRTQNNVATLSLVSITLKNTFILWVCLCTYILLHVYHDAWYSQRTTCRTGFSLLTSESCDETWFIWLAWQGCWATLAVSFRHW